jgi:hypothetical protein
MDAGTAQHRTIIHTRHAAHIGRKRWLDPRPLRIGKPEEISPLAAPSMRR